MRHESDFTGLKLPFGCGVHYKPSAKREADEINKFGDRTRPGIFMGYHLHSGGKWSGDYLVVDAIVYAEHSEDFAAHVHRVKEIVVGDAIDFPVKDD